MDKESAIQDNQGMVMQLARRYNNARVEFLDLVQAGNVGLLEASERYDEAKSNGASFCTYARYWVEKYIREAVADSHIVKIPPHIQSKRNKIAEAKATYRVHFGDTPDEAELAAMLDMTEDEIAKTNFRQDILYFSDHNRAGVGQPTNADYKLELVALKSQVTDEDLSSQHTLSDFIKYMPDKEAFVLFSRQEGCTLEQIGKELGGICRERVRQLEEQALNRIRKRLKKNQSN